MRCQKFTEIGGWEGAAVSCRELPEIRINEETGGAAVSYHEMQDNGRIGWREESAGS
jgi:hypothetical protein